MTGLLEGPDEVQEERKEERGDGGLMEIFGGFEDAEGTVDPESHRKVRGSNKPKISEEKRRLMEQKKKERAENKKRKQ